MASPIRAERDLCANALCSSSEIALMLRVVVEAVCILQCYAGRRMWIKTHSPRALHDRPATSFERFATDNQYDTAVLPAENRVYADRQTQAAQRLRRPCSFYRL